MITILSRKKGKKIRIICNYSDQYFFKFEFSIKYVPTKEKPEKLSKINWNYMSLMFYQSSIEFTIWWCISYGICYAMDVVVISKVSSPTFTLWNVIEARITINAQIAEKEYSFIVGYALQSICSYGIRTL